MIKIYGTMICPDCEALKKRLMSECIPFEFCDFSAATQNLKDFLKIRDNHANDSLFDPVREAGGVGIPCIVLEDGTITLDPEVLFTEED